MAASSSALVLVLFLAACSCCFHAADAEPKAAGAGNGEEDLVEKVCANGTSDFCHLHLKKNYCVSTLRLDSRSARAKQPRDLALVAIDLARRAAAAADAKAAAILERKSSEEAARFLRYCRSDYAAVAHLAAVCRGTVEAYRLREDGTRDPMRMYHNTECATKLINAAKDCADRSHFEEELGEVLHRDFIDVARRTALVKAMVEVMIGEKDRIHGFDDDFGDE